ncbi:MAG: hypothetical protein M3R24_33620 [Chloroflexota bacterium]|nr:hypothetical protein [Chloroflexota bacterium]
MVYQPVSLQNAPSIKHALRGLSSQHQLIIQERYLSILPVLLILMRRREIYERNRTWPGTSPTGHAATSWLTAGRLRYARNVINAYAEKECQDRDVLWRLFQAYCHYGPIGLVDVLPIDLAPLITDELQECATFHRIGKHPRSDAGMYIREILDMYADELQLPRLPPFVARYAWATHRYLDWWFVGESEESEHVSKITRRLNSNAQYPNAQWQIRIAPLPFDCLLSGRHRIHVQPWLTWAVDKHAPTLMGFRVCPSYPRAQDLWLTLRWAIWHYEAPWWKARGVPDEVLVPEMAYDHSADVLHALEYLRVQVRAIAEQAFEAGPTVGNNFIGWPSNFGDWVQAHADQARSASLRSWTLSDVRVRLLEFVQTFMNDSVFAKSTPTTLTVQQCSLPWSGGIASTLLLPSAGTYVVTNKKVIVSGVPYDVALANLADGALVQIYYDPDDARSVFVVHNGAHVFRASASAFEHHVNWYELREMLPSSAS